MIAGNDILGRGEELGGRSIVLGVAGGIAAYKAAQLVRDLQRAGASVKVVMTASACKFVGPATFQALSGQPVFVDAWDARIDNAMAHIELTRGADAILLAPATADLLARLALGRADDLLTTLCLAREVPLLVAPAMNRQMWANPATKRNVQRLRGDGILVLGPGSGDQACGEVGDGRMLEPAELVEELTVFFAPKLLAGKRILMTAGPTFEPIDPVRGITNLSSGKMGYALARACRHAGAQVTLVSGPTALQPAAGIKCIQVQTAQQMMAAVDAELDRAASSIRMDCFIAVAAVADWRIAEPSSVKLKKAAADSTPPSLELVENPDILAAVAKRPMAPYCVGFAAESHDLAAHAQVKREKKGVPLIVGNIGPQTFGKDDNELVLFEAGGSTSLGRSSKQALARRLVQEIASRLPDEAR